MDLLITRGSLQIYAGHPHAAAADLRAAVRLARHGGALFPHRAQLYLCQSLFVIGDWDEALVHGRVALSLVADAGRAWHAGRPTPARLRARLARRLGGRSEHMAAADARRRGYRRGGDTDVQALQPEP